MNRSFTIEEFHNLVYVQQQNLVVLDNKVLDFADYDHLHPGGKFTLKKNRGRDISKFFYGSYKLVNSSDEKPRNHSASAMAIANSMIIGNI